MAPAGSGKTTTLVARIAWLIDEGAGPDELAAITFNKRAAEELAERLDAALAPLAVSPRTVRVRTFHALGREILRDAGVDVSRLVQRSHVLAELFPALPPAAHGRLDTAFSRLKLDHGVTAEAVAADPDAGPMAQAFVRYERWLTEHGALDFDDLVGRALVRLTADDSLLARWRSRCAHLLVDELQDVDRSQLRLALLLAAPANRVFLVGDDDQSIYGWRLADVRRIMSIGDRLPGLRRVDLEVNHRCPVPVVERAVRLIAANRERFAKTIRPRPDAPGRLILAPDADDGPERMARILRSWPDDGGSRAVLARTIAELLPAAVAAVDLGIPFRADRVALLTDDPRLDEHLARVAAAPSNLPLLVRAGAARTPDGEPGIADAVLAWAAPYRDLDTVIGAIASFRDRVTILRRDDADLTLASAHSTKGLEFDHVAVVGLDAGRFPSARAVASAEDPDRALEEERRLAYVAWTRARRTLTLSYDPAVPSPFLLEAFSADELGLVSTG
ncbi:MAG: ATP-dependent helicase [Candidatus Limnocylindria bacterium]